MANDLGVASVGGAMAFDMEPDRSSWEMSSSTYRPGLGAPSLRKGKANMTQEKLKPSAKNGVKMHQKETS